MTISYSRCIAAGALLLLVPSLAFAEEGQAAPAPAEGAPAAAEPAKAEPAKAEPAKDADKEAEAKRPAPNSIFAELGGAGLYYSINYERRVIDDLGVRLGFMYISYGASASAGGATASASYSMLAVPLTVQYLGVRSGKHGLEAGAGITFTNETGVASANGTSASGSLFTPVGTVHVGYRLHPVAKAGFQFRVGVMALMGKGYNVFGDNPADFGVLPYGYLSLGAGF